MDRNRFYIIFGIVALAELLAFWISISLDNPLVIQISVVLGAIFLYLVRRRVEDPENDERAALITQKAALRTLEVFWVIFFAIGLGSVVIGFDRPFHLPRPPPPIGPASGASPEGFRLIFIGGFGFFLLVLLFLMIFLFVAFRIYYAREYGEWDKDEE